ncbi:MAG: alpha/beta hydrolase [Desulfobacterales bacterium]|nr:MAG: alpha/beta hydrolase [Desulfobacterales bacterium]
MPLLYFVAGAFAIYLLLSLVFTYLVHQIPRRTVHDQPDWGQILDTKIPAIDGGFLEIWRIEPPDFSKGIVVFVHGWGRNRDRMVSRAKVFARWGYTTIVFSARDHGGSSPRRFMNAIKFSEDIEAILNWVEEPVILYGHSAGAAGAIIAASGNPEKITLLFLEGCYADTKEALLSLYRWFNWIFGNLFGPVILFWMDLFYQRQLDAVSPARLAPSLAMPTMLIHGEKDQRFPLEFALRLKEHLPPERSDVYIAPGAHHSDSSQTAGYQQAVKAFLDRYSPAPD